MAMINCQLGWESSLPAFPGRREVWELVNTSHLCHKSKLLSGEHHHTTYTVVLRPPILTLIYFNQKWEHVHILSFKIMQAFPEGITPRS